MTDTTSTTDTISQTTWLRLYGGQNVYIRTVTYHYTGRLIGTIGDNLVITDAAWIAESGHWSQVLNKGFGSNAEIEPYPDGANVTVGAVVDVSPWLHDLPREVR